MFKERQKENLELIWPTFSNDSLLSFVSTWRFFLMACEPSCELLSRVTCWVLQTYNKHQQDHASTHTNATRIHFHEQKCLQNTTKTQVFFSFHFAAFELKAINFMNSVRFFSRRLPPARHSRLHHTTKIFSELNNAVSLLYNFSIESVYFTSIEFA